MNIYVGNLPTNATEESLKQLFEQYGNVVSVRMMRDRMTGQLRGFAFVQMASQDEAQEAIGQLQGHEFGGNRLRVNEARPRTERPQRPGGSNGGGRPYGGGGQRFNKRSF